MDEIVEIEPNIETAANRLKATSIVAVRWHLRKSVRNMTGQVQAVRVTPLGDDVIFTLIEGPDYEPIALSLSQCDIAPIDQNGKANWEYAWGIASVESQG